MYSKSLDAENKVASKILMEGEAILLFSLLFLHKTFAIELDTISNSRFLTYGDTLVSATGVFELGFFQPGSSKNTYLGMWYKKIPARTVVWVANRDRPLLGASSLVLKIVDRGILGLLTNTSMVWSSNTTTSGNTTAKLQDNGNLVVVDQHETVVWQSFDYPTDTLLPGMKIGRDYLRGKEWHLSSWKSGEDPSPGESILDVDTLGYPESKIRQGSLIKSRDAPWTNVRSLPGTSVYNKNLTYRFDVIINENEVSWTCILEDNSILLRATLSSSVLDCWVLVDYARGWQLALSFPGDACDTYNICNAYGTCNTDTIQQSCTCFDEKRFAPKNPKAWETADWSGGCIRRTPLECKNGSEGFVKYSNVKLPYTKNTWYNMSMTLEECGAKCLKNCSCMAYANPDTSRSICLLWFDALLDIRMSMPEGGRDIFVRMASSELDSPSISKNEGGTKIKNILFLLIPGVLLTGLIVATWLCYAQRKRNHAKVTTEGGIMNASKSQEDMERPLFSFTAIANATANFSPDNKLGEGGFGPVYKGMLEEGKEIAVKRLSKHSTQGPDEFKNEVVCISKLQHRNLVKLLGCCIQGDEKLLIYEYMPNKSLDSFIFDKTKSVLLDWTKRFNIIKGIARGLLYLHQDSRLRIIHRDIKTSNILLDEDMNPKISDFGLARCFGGNETQASTERVVGTYGYMSPEYALDGLFSIKSDVFSFGVLVLEIVSGKRNRGFIQPESKNNLFEHVWSLYNEGRPMELIDETCVESCHPPEVVRSIKVGLLCVQQNAEDRPNMSNVILMLGRENELLEPKHPSYFIEKELPVINYTSSSYTGDSMKDFNITEVHAQ